MFTGADINGVGAVEQFLFQKDEFFLSAQEQAGIVLFLEINLLNSTNTIDISTWQPAECQTFHTVTERGNTYLDFFAS